MPHNGMHLQLLEPALHQNIAFGVGRTGSIRRAQRWLGLARSNMLGRRLGGGIDRTAHLGRRDWRDWLTGTTFTWLLGMLGGTAKHCSTETWKFLKASIGWLDGLDGEKAEGRGFGGEESGRADVPFGHATVASAFSVADNGQSRQPMAQNGWWPHARGGIRAPLTPKVAPPRHNPWPLIPSHPCQPLPIHAICEDQLLLSSSFLSTYSKKPFSQIHSFPFPRSRLLVDLILRSISHSTTTKHLKVARPTSSISAPVRFRPTQVTRRTLHFAVFGTACLAAWSPFIRNRRLSLGDPRKLDKLHE